MLKRGLIVIFAALFGMTALVACGGATKSTATSGTSGAATATSAISTATPARSAPAGSPVTSPAGTLASPATSAATGALASPSAVASPGSLAASPTGGEVDLATAYANLVAKGSYSMTVKFQNLPGVLSIVQGIGGNPTLVVQRSGNDRHVVVQTSSGATVVELWRVGGQDYANVAGAGPVQATASDPVLGRFIPLLDADSVLITELSSRDANYRVTGTETVNGVASQAEAATYTAKTNPDSLYFNSFTGGSMTVNSKIWVATSGDYLVRGDMALLQAAANGTPAAGTSTTTQPSVIMDVTQVGQPITITAPK